MHLLLFGSPLQDVKVCGITVLQLPETQSMKVGAVLLDFLSGGLSSTYLDHELKHARSRGGGGSAKSHDKAQACCERRLMKHP